MNVPEFFRWTAEFFCGYSFRFYIFISRAGKTVRETVFFRLFRVRKQVYPAADLPGKGEK